jgi:hypothetical protein
MANKILWVAESAATLMTTELDNLAKTSGIAFDGADYDNATNKFRFADFELYLEEFDAAPAAGGYFELHIIYKLDGTNYADGYDGDLDADSNLGGATSVGSFGPLSANEAPHRFQITGVPLSPKAFRAAIVNRSTQDLADASSHTLKIFPYNEEVQA